MSDQNKHNEAFESQLRKAVILKNREELKERWKQKVDFNPDMPVLAKNKRRWWSYAMIALTLLLVLFVYKINSKTSVQMAEGLIASHEIILDPSITVKGSVELKNDILSDAYENIQNREYDTSLKLIMKAATIQPLEVKDKFYRANVLLKLNQTQKAIIDLEEVVVASSDYMEEAEWLISIAYLKLGMDEKAMPYLQKIVLNKQYRFNEANLLLNHFNK